MVNDYIPNGKKKIYVCVYVSDCLFKKKYNARNQTIVSYL